MTRMEHLTEQHILEHESRLKHMDELLERARKGLGKGAASEYEAQLQELDQERQKLQDHIEALKNQTREEWQEESFEQAGPMIIWEAVAKRLEKLVERIEREPV